MPPIVSDRAVARTLRGAYTTLGDDIRRQREDAGINRRELARSSGADPSFLARIELGTARPSLETYARLALALGADLSAKVCPNTGPLVRDRHQAAIAESLVSILHSSWVPFAEIAVRRPSRGWIDLGLRREPNLFVATEIQSDLRRLEQLIRWSEEKAASLRSWDGWTRLVPEPTISRLLVVRSTRRTREVAAAFRRVLRLAYPSDPDDAVAALTRGDGWPGHALLWAVRNRGEDRYRIIARPRGL